MILLNVIGRGARGLAAYLSQFNKSSATTNDHKNELRVPDLHQPYLNLNPRVGHGKPGASLSSLPSLSERRLDGKLKSSEVLLSGYAHLGVEPGRDGRADQLRRPADKPGRNGRKSEQGAVAPFLTNMAGTTPRELSAEVGVLRRLRPQLTRAISHLVLSHDPGQRRLTDDEWRTAIAISLEEHGASEAAFSAWLHHDCDHQHAHIMFSRVLPRGEVVSDSHNFVSNARAARRIEKELNLNPPTPTPTEDRPGDRQALQNAKRRAERRGTPGPALDAREVRKAAAAARSRADYARLLAEKEIEIDFKTRGEKNEVYGYLLRKKGAEEWIKASTLAKDLSWPQIANKFAFAFAESDLAEEIQEHEAVAPAATPVVVVAAEEVAEPIASLKRKVAPDAEDRYTHAPESIKHILQNTESPKQMRERVQRERQKYGWAPISQTRKEKSGPAVEVRQTANATRSRLIKLLVNLAVELRNVLSDVAAAVMAFLQRVLAFFGFRVDERALQNQEQPPDVRPALELFELKAAQPEDDEETRSENAVVAVAQLTQALRDDDPSLLPKIDCVEKEVLQTLMMPRHDTAKSPLSMDDLGLDSVNYAPEPVAAQVGPAASTADPIVSLKQSGAEFFEAIGALMQAVQKPDCGLTVASQNLKAAEAELVAARREYAEFKKRDKTIFRIYQPPEAARVFRTESQFEEARVALAAAEVLQSQVPAPATPPLVSARLKVARAAFEADSRALAASMKAQAAGLADASLRGFALERAGTVAAQLDVALRAHQHSVFLQAAETAEATRAEIVTRRAEIERLARQQIQLEHVTEVPRQMDDEIERPRG